MSVITQKNIIYELVNERVAYSKALDFIKISCGYYFLFLTYTITRNVTHIGRAQPTEPAPRIEHN